VKVISRSERNVFPVVDKEGYFKGIVFMNDIREIIFQPKQYNKVYVKDLMFDPKATVTTSDSMEHVAKVFQETGNYNLPVLENGRYLGFVSRANVFSTYRKLLKEFSE